MSSPRSPLPPAVQQALQQLVQPLSRWHATLAARERLAVAAAAWVLALAALWALAVQPAWRTLRDAPARLTRVEQQLQDMQAQAADARTLRALPPVPRAQALVALRAATERLEGARLAEQGDRAVLTLDGVAPSAFRQWLGEVRASARARTVEARLSRDERGLSGTLVVAIGAAP